MPCIIPGCQNNAENNFSVRLRRPVTRTAIWAPDTEAFIFNTHAIQGLRVTVILEPTNDRQIETKVCGIQPPTADRKTPIKNLP
jgi:hypothetical protein